MTSALAAIARLETSVGSDQLYGILATIPSMILGGPLYGASISRRMDTKPEQALRDHAHREGSPKQSARRISLGVLHALLPAVPMLVHAVAEMLLPKGPPTPHVGSFLGNPLIAMLLGLLFASVALVIARDGDAGELRGALGASLKPFASIIMIIAGGGALQQMLTSAKVRQRRSPLTSSDWCPLQPAAACSPRSNAFASPLTYVRQPAFPFSTT